jgi:CheY-like chemotaxis protein
MAVGLDAKRIFLVVAHLSRITAIQEAIERHVSQPTIFAATDGLTGLSKFQNVPPHVLIAEMDLPKMHGLRLVDQALTAKGAESSAMILIGQPPAEERHLDEIVTGRVQYWTSDSEDELATCLMRAMNYASQKDDHAEFHLRFLAKGDVLLKEGEKADFVYFVKKGDLEAVKRSENPPVVLGRIGFGEFVGEMAYINGEPRSADVTALTDCELIEVPVGRFEKVLFRRPSWSKALMLTLSKRLKQANESKVST